MGPQNSLARTCKREDLVTLSFGSTAITISLDDAYELQHQLASFLAFHELQQLPPIDGSGDPDLRQTREELQKLLSFRDLKRYDA